MFNKKRQVRECTNQLLEFDTYERTMTVMKTTGFSAGARKNHCATMYKKSMIIYGGQSESGVFYNEMIVLHMEYLEWAKLHLKSGMQPFTQGACCSVYAPKKKENESLVAKVSYLISVMIHLNTSRAMRSKKASTSLEVRTRKVTCRTSCATSNLSSSTERSCMESSPLSKPRVSLLLLDLAIPCATCPAIVRCSSQEAEMMN